MKASIHKSVMTHAGNVFLPLADRESLHAHKNWQSAAALTAEKRRRENPVSLAWLVRLSIAARKTQRGSCTQQAAILRAV